MVDPTPGDQTRSKPVPLVPLPVQDLLVAPRAVPLTSFVGREREVAVVADLLRQDGVRLVTVAGPGSVGKTRLALRLADALRPGYADGVAFVDLTPFADPDLVAPAVAEVLGLREVGVPSAARLVDAPSGRHRLLVLDNFEQPGSAPTPGVSIWAKSFIARRSAASVGLHGTPSRPDRV